MIDQGDTARIWVGGTPGERVDLWASSASTPLRVVRTGTTNERGLASWLVRPGEDTRLYATASDGLRQSLTIILQVRRPAAAPALEIALQPKKIVRGQTSRVWVAGHPGERVNLYAFTSPSTTYRLVRTGVTNNIGLISWPVRPGNFTRLYAAPAAGPSTRNLPSVVIAVTAPPPAPGTACSTTGALYSYTDSAQCLFKAYAAGSRAVALRYASRPVVDELWLYRPGTIFSNWQYQGCTNEPESLSPSSGVACAYYDVTPVGAGHGVLIEFGMNRSFKVEEIGTIG